MSERFLAGFLVPAAVGAVLLVATTLLFFAGPAADDFCRAVIDDVSKHFVETYLTHAGRWATVGFLVPLILGRIELFSAQYGGLMLLLWLGYFFTYLFLATVALGAATKLGTRALIAALVTAVWWCGLPAPGQTVYWASAGLEYGLGFQAMAVLFGALALHATSHRTPARALAGTVAFALGVFVVTGIHEVVALCVLGLLSLFAALAFVRRAATRWLFGLCWLVALTGAAVSILAPGNAVRAARAGGSGVSTPGYSLYLDWYERLVPWLTDPRLLALSLLVLTSPRLADLRPRWPQLAWDRLGWVIPLASLVLVAGCLALPAIVLGEPGPGRLHNFAYSIFTVGWFLTLVAAGPRVPLATFQGAGALRAAAALLFVVSLLFTGNMRDAVSALAGRNNLLRWHALLQSLPDKGAKAKAESRGSLILDARLEGPSIYNKGFRRLPDGDATGFINRCLAHYLRLERVLVKGEAPKP